MELMGVGDRKIMLTKMMTAMAVVLWLRVVGRQAGMAVRVQRNDGTTLTQCYD